MMADGPIRTLIAGNWKMHGLRAQIGEIDAIACSVRARPSEIDVLVCVPATLIAGAVQAADGLITIGGEDCSAREAGPFTGDIDAEMLRDAGAESVILGHSERPNGITKPTQWSPRKRKRRGSMIWRRSSASAKRRRNVGMATR